MKKKHFNFSLMLASSALLFGTVGLTACTTGISIAQVRLSSSVLEMKVGDDAVLKIQVSKEFAGADLYWVSTNENVALVKDGHVLATGVGECEVHAYIGGGRAICKVIVTEGEGGGGGGGEPTTPYLRINPTSRTLQVGGTFKITCNYYPSDTTVTFASESTDVATVGSDGTVSAIAVGSTRIVVTGSNEKTEYCNVTVSDASAGPTNEDIGGLADLHATGSFVIGSPSLHTDLTNSLLQDFNKYTNSNITWEIKDFEESQAASNLTPDASLGPDVFPYASDQTQGLYTLKALTILGKSDRTWIKSEMGQDALDASKLGSIGNVGYPFAADNGYCLFYDKSKVDTPEKEEKLTTMSGLFELAASYTNPQQRKFRVSYDVANGFYGAGALMSYTKGKNLYEYVAMADGYKSRAFFNSEEGIKGAEAVANIFANNNDTLNSQYMIPSDGTRTLAVITDCSKVNDLKKQMGDNYAVAPLPFIDDAKTTRLGSFLGYKFYGVNNKKLGNDTAKKAVAEAIARFFVSKYAQEQRLKQFGIQPTTIALQKDAKAQEPHISALMKQKDDYSTIQLTVVDPTFWNQVGVAITDIEDAVKTGTASHDKLVSIMDDLTGTLLHDWDE